MKLISPTDAIFLLGESREHPMHVGGLGLYEAPGGMSGSDFLRDLHQDMVAQQDFQPTFRKHPATVFGGIANLAWAFDDDVDLDYHLRRSGLPAPGRVRDLLELTSRLHGTLLDRHRPLWETHLVEGLNDGRFAVYVKFHHALIDGVSALKVTQRTCLPIRTIPRCGFRGIYRPSIGRQRVNSLRCCNPSPGQQDRSRRLARRPCRLPAPHCSNSS